MAAVLLGCAALAAAVTLWTDALHAELLNGRRAPHREDDGFVTSFDLLAEEARSQTQPRIGGWLSVADVQEVVMQNSRGRHSASLCAPYGGAQDAPWALVVHGGLGTTRAQVQDIACELSLNGYRVLTPDLYAHGQSDGDCASLGTAPDAQDVLDWIGFILREEMDAQIVLFGQEAGADAVLLALASDELPANVRAAAIDSAFCDSAQRLRDLTGLGEGTLQERLLLDRLSIEGEGGVLEAAAQIAVPLLVIHGTGDREVSAWQAEDIAAAAGENAQLLLIEGANHGDARYIDPQTYFAALLALYGAALQN